MKTTKSMQIAAAGVVGIALIAGSLLATTGVAVAKSSSAPRATNCQVAQDDTWPAWVQGIPHDIDPRTTTAIYMWHDNGWHIRVTHHKTNLRTFSGQLHTSGQFTDVRPTNLDRDDQFQVSPDRHDITFLFNNHGGINGLDFYTHCAPSITFSYQSDGRTSPPNNIVIGQHSSRPSNDPFTVTR